MKKVTYISMLFIVLTTLSVQAQRSTQLSSTSSEMCNQRDPQQLQMIRNAEAHLMQSYNDKSKPRLKPTGLSYERPCSEFEQEMHNNAPNVYGRLRDVENYNRALKVATKAEKEKEKAERVYVNLSSMQLDKKDTKKLEKAQKNLEKANRNYFTALKNLKRARLELDKYR